ncbi:MAG: hypothetical protein LJE69_12130 [Thiohalocapsa sp.]|uniref:hypothetical protein n=1 Tax=Thiohalocapsa sp. TaxID=2497641 RepID=UPI0025E26A96|nr:hypothetical protein [Thiohalocapsa sp.]MCG6941984.1 hypothetical protein [Thiohalocapsa sp.]
MHPIRAIRCSIRRSLRRCSSRHGVCRLLAATALLATPEARASVVAGVTFDPANAVTTAEVTSLGYWTPFGDAALPSDTSADWSVGASLGNLFLRPPFQDGYSPTTPVYGAPGTAVTLGQEPSYPLSGNVRETIRLTWGGSLGLPDGDNGSNGSADDLVIFEQATSEAFAISVHVASGGSVGWSKWFYVPYENAYDSANDATPTLIDLDLDLGLPGVTINALEIASLAPADTVAEQIAGADVGLGRGQVTFGGASGGLTPARWSSSQGKWVPFESYKLDPDIQFVAGLQDLVAGDFGTISAVSTAADGSAPDRAPPTGTPAAAPVVAPLPLLLTGLSLLGVLRGTTWPRRRRLPRPRDLALAAAGSPVRADTQQEWQ